jgi:hypothetical protein
MWPDGAASGIVPAVAREKRKEATFRAQILIELWGLPVALELPSGKQMRKSSFFPVCALGIETAPKNLGK